MKKLHLLLGIECPPSEADRIDLCPKRIPWPHPKKDEPDTAQEQKTEA